VAPDIACVLEYTNPLLALRWCSFTIEPHTMVTHTDEAPPQHFETLPGIMSAILDFRRWCMGCWVCYSGLRDCRYGWGIFHPSHRVLHCSNDNPTVKFSSAAYTGPKQFSRCVRSTRYIHLQSFLHSLCGSAQPETSRVCWKACHSRATCVWVLCGVCDRDRCLQDGPSIMTSCNLVSGSCDVVW